MERSSGWNMYVFREARRCIEGKFLLDGLRSALLDLENAKGNEQRLSALVWAGELECALADARSQFVPQAAEILDALARLLIAGRTLDIDQLLRTLDKIEFEQQVSVSPPEGFAYYALHPLNFADLAQRFARPGGLAGVVGIRSIGTTLSAVVSAKLQSEGMMAERTTVRPGGHPYDRRVELGDDQRAWVQSLQERGAEFMIVDEGPGISGSSFLAVGEALERHGVPADRIKFFCSRPINPHSFVAPNAVERYAKFQYFNSPYSCMLPDRGEIFVGNGLWREKLLPKDEPWPGAWTGMERSKFIAADRKSMLKFHGYGRFGSEVAERLQKVAAAGFGPAYLGSEEGFGRTQWVNGRHATVGDLSREILMRISEYCAFRAHHMVSERASTRELLEAVCLNWEYEFGSPLRMELQLDVRMPVIADSKMQPHEWILTSTGASKIDSETHGDDHFLPGPTDIAWDLAGAMIEWNMTEEDCGLLLREYERLTGDDLVDRIKSYLLAYSIFRFAYCKMGAQATTGTIDEQLLRRDYLHYRETALRLVSPGQLRAA